ncbi:hypothetical protein CHLRE_12g484900v5 [Chlamydomonas reinhardtii]|uniref:Uncharacterized protein n=1 Tax=Chlamydomonas reinhardtii TaxID=3055 RepID=A0A2K3D1R4_CHLRE|nr:uncharacterized protein CHLRE_12g484900v5 [Chlamydomonas reinhardtii]PNW74459.1 hypothetical protein CHLRE_12g484900v5 [Chlamydomonas reinhardtii]
MADRGRKAFPVSSHVCDEKWQRHCMDLHKQRLTDMKHRIDTEKPETFDMQLSKGKRAMLEKERQYEIDRENAILLQKMVRIKEQDTRAVFRPWTARSTFQWKLGHYYDPSTGTKTLDHINLTSSVSPRSIHYYALSRPGTAPPDVTARMRDMQIQSDNTKLLRTITTMRSVYSVDDLERRHVEESVLVNRISNFRGPETARYNPPGRSASASRRSPYLQPLSGQRATSSARPARHSPVTSSAPGPLRSSNGTSQQRYLEEAQGRDIPPPSSRGGSRPGTAIAGPRAQNGSGSAGSGGLGATSPRASDPNAERRASGSAASSRGGSGSGAQAAAAPTGQSFSFGAKPEAKNGVSQTAAKKAADTSADDYGDETYEQDEEHYEADPDQEEAEQEEEEEASPAAAKSEEEEEDEKPAARAASNTGSAMPDTGADAAGESYGDEGFEAEKEEQEEGAAPQDEGEEDQEEDKAGEEEAEQEEAEQEEAEQEEAEAEADGGFQEDAEEGPKSELEKAEEEEMAAQFNAGMTEDAEGGDDAPLPSPGGFANDWS